eukprot:2527988-Alexandrium_andersonii.AAC.1
MMSNRIAQSDLDRRRARKAVHFSISNSRAPLCPYAVDGLASPVFGRRPRQLSSELRGEARFELSPMTASGTLRCPPI